MNCPTCEAPKRSLWTAQEAHIGKIPDLMRLHISTHAWGSLWRCDTCSSLWSRADYEPWGGYPYLIYWQYSEDAWLHVTDSKRGRLFAHWHEQRVLDLIDAIPSKERVPGPIGCLSRTHHSPVSLDDLMKAEQ